KMPLIMRLTAFLLLASVIQVSGKALSQSVTVNIKTGSLEKVFQEVEKQTGFVIFYESGMVRHAKPVSIAARKEPMRIFLDRLFSRLELEYVIENSTIVVSRKKGATGSGQTSQD